MKRRTLLKAAAVGSMPLALRPAVSIGAVATDPVSRLAALERRHGGRLGVAIVDSETGQRFAHRGDERFLLCSTFKLLLAAAVLHRVDKGMEQLDRRIVYERPAVLKWAPVTMLNVGTPGMPVQALCEAATLMSDNTAANLLLTALGGPAAVTRYARSLGDTLTRLDHYEPLDKHQQGNEDTTTPWAMLADMRQIILGNALSEASRSRLRTWFALNQTGAQTLRAGLPSHWHVGDKTGAAAHANNDIAVVTPPDRKPLLVTAYYSNNAIDVSARKAVLADVGRIAAALPEWLRSGARPV